MFNLDKFIAYFVTFRSESVFAKAPVGHIFNYAGHILNHNLYFTQFKTPSQTESGGMQPDHLNALWNIVDRKVLENRYL